MMEKQFVLVYFAWTGEEGTISEEQQEMGHLTMEALAVLLSGNSGNAGTGNIICFGFEVRLKNILHARQTFVQSAKNCMHSMESNKDVT